MAINPTIPQEEMSLLEWLGREDSSAYGECYSTQLNSLRAKGFIDWKEVPQLDRMYWRVTVTPAGFSILQQRDLSEAEGTVSPRSSAGLRSVLR